MFLLQGVLLLLQKLIQVSPVTDDKEDKAFPLQIFKLFCLCLSLLGKLT